MDVTIRPFKPDDQTAARRLIVEGLGEHFGVIDETRNSDLNDIVSSYAKAVFLVAEEEGQLVGTGALIPDIGGVARIVRMSVRGSHRRRRIGRVILERLLEHARLAGRRWVTLATNSDWEDANAFYLVYGFREVGRGLGGVAFALNLGTNAKPSWLRSRLLLALLLWRRLHP